MSFYPLRGIFWLDPKTGQPTFLKPVESRVKTPRYYRIRFRDVDKYRVVYPVNKEFNRVLRMFRVSYQLTDKQAQQLVSIALLDGKATQYAGVRFLKTIPVMSKEKLLEALDVLHT